MAYSWNNANVVIVGTRSRKPKVTIRRAGGVHLNSALIREYNLQDKQYVKALILKEEKKVVIGFIFLDKKEENTLKLAFGKENKNAGFSGRSIFTEAGFDTEKRAPVSFEPKVENYEGDRIFIIELKKE